MSDEANNRFTVLHIPHSSRLIPDDVRERIALSDNVLNDELLKLTDWYTDEIFDIDTHIAKKVVFKFSRIVVDPERFLNDDYEPMAECGMGAVYTKTSNGDTLRLLDDDYRNKLIKAYYKPHHDALTRAVDEAVSLNGFCLILDCHSFPAIPLPCELDKTPDRPDICIGTDDFHTPTEIAEKVVRVFTEAGFSVELNKPYNGTLVPMDFFRNDKRVIAFMIEINRSLYMDEKTGDQLVTFDMFATQIKRIVLELILLVKQYWNRFDANY